jgi:lipoprotein NlpI
MKRIVFPLFLLLSWSLCGLAQEKQLSPRALVRQGIEHFKEGKIKESISDFETAARLQPGLKPHLWQLGISYYYAGEFEKGRRLFESHQTVNPQDVENAVWHFLCIAKLKNVEAARKAFIPITDDQRVPMKEVHGLFAGKLSKEDVLNAARSGHPSAAELKERLFYAYLYLGLYDEAANHPEESLAELKKAAGEFAQPHYMCDVAKIDLKLREAGSAQAK